MAKEIERKYLCKMSNEYNYSEKLASYKKERIEQHYISNDLMKCEMRVRRKGEKFYLTIKSAESGLERYEYETIISETDYNEMVKFSNGSVVKDRYYIPSGEHTFDVDVYDGSNYSLVVCEVELKEGEEGLELELPEFVVTEVTGNKEYSNKNLSKN